MYLNIEHREMDAAVCLYRGEILANELYDIVVALSEPNANPLLYRQLYWIPLTASLADEGDFEAKWQDMVLDIVLKEAEVSEEELGLWHRNFVTAEQQLLVTDH